MKCILIFSTTISFILLSCGSIAGQKPMVDSLTNTMSYSFDSVTYVYPKPKHFSFITQLPRTFSNTAKETFNRKSISAISIIAASTLLLVPLDQHINDGVNQFSRYINLNSERDYNTLISFKLGNTPVNVYEVPQNINTVFYSIGEGSTSLLLCAGLYLHGKIKNDYRSLQTSSQLMQTLIAIGLTTQVIKRISGRESPFNATVPGGKWRPLPNLATYQKNVSHYDAYPSGHLATMMATTTVLALNYPEKKWIRPVGYGLITLVGLAMINNGVHWAGDYPLALGIGYVFGKATVNMNRWVKGQ